MNLAQVLVAAAPQAPQFEREVVHPAMGKLAVGCTKQIERLQNESSVIPVLRAMRNLLLASPAVFRPTANTLRPILYRMLLNGPEAFRLPAADLLSVLHFTSGKAGAPAAWSSEMKDALGGVSASVSALTADAWEEEPLRAPAFPAPATFPTPPMDPLARTVTSVAGIEGYIEACVALLTVPASRPVPVPLAQVISVALRLLSLSLDSPMAPHISPAHRAALLSSLPRLWNAGVLLLASAITVCGDHVLPHLEAILEHTVYLLEHIPATMTESRLRLLHLHSLLLEQFSAAVLPLEYTQRLLKFALGVMGSVMEQKQPTVTAVKKGKKRARGQEDALIGGLEGRAPKPVSEQVANVVLAALDITPRLHRAPLLPASHLTLSLRLHISMYLTLPSRTASFTSPTSLPKLNAAVTRALEDATVLSVSGTARDIRTLLISILPPTTTTDLLLHPSLPPMSRPAPPLAQLQFIQESEEERKLRRELGYSNGDDDEDDEDDDMAVDEPAVKRVNVQSVTMQKVSPLEAVAQSVSAEVLTVPTPAIKTAPGAPVLFGGVAPVATSTPAARAPAVASVPFGSTPAPAPISVPTPADTPTPAAEASAAESSAAPAVPFMSTPSSKPVSSSSALDPPPPAADVAMVVDEEDDDDEAIPELDSGSSDEGEEDDDDE